MNNKQAKRLRKIALQYQTDDSTPQKVVGKALITTTVESTESVSASESYQGMWENSTPQKIVYKALKTMFKNGDIKTT